MGARRISRRLVDELNLFPESHVIREVATDALCSAGQDVGVAKSTVLELLALGADNEVLAVTLPRAVIGSGTLLD